MSISFRAQLGKNHAYFYDHDGVFGIEAGAVFIFILFRDIHRKGKSDGSALA